MDLEQHIEALIFTTDQPVSVSEITKALAEVLEDPPEEGAVTSAITALQEKYKDDIFAFEPVKSGGGYQFLTKPDYTRTISVLLKQRSSRRLSRAALETLAIIAYKQPVTRGEIDRIRGVSSDYTVQKLLDKALVMIRGKQDSPGKPILYGTSESFLDYFGINALDELPRLKDFRRQQQEIGFEDEEEEN